MLMCLIVDVLGLFFFFFNLARNLMVQIDPSTEENQID